ncbi:hypothetical protein PROSTU_03793 [Providencia stuartii ATCC 25827]|uniref:Uncharacterized protein n=1 Tax=Providencia stuartii ATCC 25827 TaxID=471874 RepID=A0AA86YT99_PROST|nr:hypothetical protein PROSTU_03793 [Providencia stuartii ATCC 25827]
MNRLAIIALSQATNNFGFIFLRCPVTNVIPFIFKSSVNALLM